MALGKAHGEKRNEKIKLRRLQVLSMQMISELKKGVISHRSFLQKN